MAYWNLFSPTSKAVLHSCSANFFDVDGDSSNGCESGCPALPNAHCILDLNNFLKDVSFLCFRGMGGLSSTQKQTHTHTHTHQVFCLSTVIIFYPQNIVLLVTIIYQPLSEWKLGSMGFPTLPSKIIVKPEVKGVLVCFYQGNPSYPPQSYPPKK